MVAPGSLLDGFDTIGVNNGGPCPYLPGNGFAVCGGDDGDRKAEWKPVENPSGYGVELDKFNTVTFTPVTATDLRMEVQCQKWRAMGISEWKIE